MHLAEYVKLHPDVKIVAIGKFIKDNRISMNNTPGIASIDTKAENFRAVAYPNVLTLVLGHKFAEDSMIETRPRFYDKIHDLYEHFIYIKARCLAMDNSFFTLLSRFVSTRYP